MKKMFDAIQCRNPDCEIVDVQISIDQRDVINQDVDDLDAAPAELVRKAEAVRPEFK